MIKYNFIVEAESFEGVKKIAHKAALDFEKVSGKLPLISESLPAPSANEINIIFATLGKSKITERITRKAIFDPSDIIGKREVYKIKFIDGEKKELLVCGSDKRGTIYGIFAVSEYIGVSPLHFWGDVDPVRCENIVIDEKIEMVSKEPDVKYRGFFINDEWPCFGTWANGQFGGFNAKMYDHVFELLLRLKGNYLWPAMWSSSFALDGPGAANEELADIYGVVIGSSHHEPCLRASEEWGKTKKQKTEYGKDWNFYTNKKGLLKYWEDGLIRSGKYEKIITIGMRGERDTSMLGRDSSLKDNIVLLKDIIKSQRELIRKHVNSDIDEVPQLLALYKEVEEYFYGNEKTEGLKDWDELENVICMLCEDNFGFVRTLPTEEIRTSNGGFGMYYHFDYHGSPVSYEWLPSTSLERTWEQMCKAYDFGVKDIWIVNVGDLKFNEVHLAYFMELAYDFKKWGSSSPNSIENYIDTWLEKTFPGTEKTIRNKMAKVFQGYIKINSLRRPEALNTDIYHPCNYLEADKMLEFAQEIDFLNEEVYSVLSKEKDAYYSLIYWAAKASTNLLRMHLCAAKNRHFANQNKKVANIFAALVSECIEKDRKLAEEFSKFKNNKWNGMQLAAHVGFTRWDEGGCRYPQRILVEPVNKARMLVSRKDSERIYTKAYNNPMTIEIDDFLYAGCDSVILEIANDGKGRLDYTIEQDEKHDWLELSSIKGKVEFQEEIVIQVNRQKLSEEIQISRLLIKDKETTVAVEIKAKKISTENLTQMTFLENNGVFVINANHFCGKKNVSGCSFIELKNYGRSGDAMKLMPATASFGEKDDKPSLYYKFLIEEAGEYITEIWTAPVNSVQKNQALRCMLTDAKGNEHIITTVPADFNTGDPYNREWSEGVLNNIRKNEILLTFDRGVKEISIGALEAGLVLEKILIFKEDKRPLPSYLGPPESFYTT